MKHFTILRNEPNMNLQLTVEGTSESDLISHLLGSKIDAYEYPKTQSLVQTWLFRIFLHTGICLQFCSIFTQIPGKWEEVASLKITLLDGARETLPIPNEAFKRIEVAGFQIKNIGCVIYQTPEVYSEIGLVLRSSEAREIVILDGISPGSVRVTGNVVDSNEPIDADRYRVISPDQLLALKS